MTRNGTPGSDGGIWAAPPGEPMAWPQQVEIGGASPGAFTAPTAGAAAGVNAPWSCAAS